MEVDVPGTAKGVWAEQGVTGPVQGDETRYMTLADYPYDPQARLALSLGPNELGARVAVVPRATSEPGESGLRGGYGGWARLLLPASRIPPIDAHGTSWLLTMPTATTLEIERVDHAGAPGPCGERPRGVGPRGRRCCDEPLTAYPASQHVGILVPVLRYRASSERTARSL